jgi:hypothetical protein
MRTVMTAAAVLALSACSVLDVTPDCPIGAEVTFAPATSSISWSPACTVDIVQVVRNDDNATYWLARGRIAPPINYGTVVSAGGVPGIPLVPGKEFTIFVIREHASGTQIGSGSFIAPVPTE